jgi:hypothetical protein
MINALVRCALPWCAVLCPGALCCGALRLLSAAMLCPAAQAIYVPADDLTDPAPATTFAHLDATTVLSRGIAGEPPRPPLWLAQPRPVAFPVAPLLPCGVAPAVPWGMSPLRLGPSPLLPPPLSQTTEREHWPYLWRGNLCPLASSIAALQVPLFKPPHEGPYDLPLLCCPCPVVHLLAACWTRLSHPLLTPPPPAELGIYPAVDPLDSTSRMLDPRILGAEHYAVARGVQKVLQDYKNLQVRLGVLQGF